MSASAPCAACGRTLPEGAGTCPWDGTPAPLNRAHRSSSGQAPTLGPIAAAAGGGSAAPRPPTINGAPAADSLIGRQLGDFVVREWLGQGGMGIVYAGEQPLIGKRVAIKVLRPEIARDPEQVQRLLAEARAVNSIRHRGIIDIFNFGQLDDGRNYVVMEYLHGQALDELIAQRGALSPAEVLEILDEVMAALGAGHEAGIIHRDLKPSNIYLVVQPDSSRYVKLLDFGLAKQSSVPRGATPQTRTDMFVGTPEYVAPEQARAEAVGPYTDLYAAGVVAFEMLTGKLPFDANAPIDFVLKHLEAKPPRPSAVMAGIPPELDALILRLLQKEPRQRPPSCEAVRREIGRIRRALSSSSTGVMQAAQAPPAAADQAAPRLTLEVGPHRARTRLWVGGALAAAALVAAGTAMIVSSVRSSRSPPPTSEAPSSSATTVPVPATPVIPSGESVPPTAPDLAPTRIAAEPARAATQPAAIPPEVAGRDLAVAPTPTSEDKKPLRAQTEAVPDRAELLRRVEQVERILRSRSGVDSPTTVLTLLEQIRSDAEDATSIEERRDLARKLRAFEQRFVAARRQPETR